MYKFFITLAVAILAINCFLYFKSYYKNGKAFRIYSIYLGLILIIEIASRVIIHFRYENLFLSHYYFTLQFILLSLFFLELSIDNLQKKIIKIGLVICPLVLVTQLILDPSLLNKFNLFEVFITSFLIIVYSTFHFYNMLSIKKEFYFVNIGIIIYLFGSTILFLVPNLVIKYYSTEMSQFNGTLNGFLYMIYQLLVLYEWKKNYYKPTV